MKVSQSKAKLWRKCRQAYHYKYIMGLRKKVKARPLQFGSIVHRMIEAHANGDDPFEELNNTGIENQKLFEAERELYGDIIQDIRFIMTDYFKYWKSQDLIYHRVGGKNAEHQFDVEIAPGIIFTGKIDAFAKKPKSKLKWLVEHKTFKRKPSEDHRWKSIQSAVYLRVVEMLGWVKLDGTCWDYIGSKPPSTPEILKNGQLSRKKISTLPSVVDAFLTANNLSFDHYKEFRALTEESQSNYFDRVFTPISKPVVDEIFKDFVATAQEIQELGEKSSLKSIDLHCDYCEYESLCRAKLNNLDFDFVKEREYNVDNEAKEEPIEVVG